MRIVGDPQGCRHPVYMGGALYVYAAIKPRAGRGLDDTSRRIDVWRRSQNQVRIDQRNCSVVASQESTPCGRGGLLMRANSKVAMMPIAAKRHLHKQSVSFALP